jgi:hypothetical protein
MDNSCSTRLGGTKPTTAECLAKICLSAMTKSRAIGFGVPVKGQLNDGIGVQQRITELWAKPLGSQARGIHEASLFVCELP